DRDGDGHVRDVHRPRRTPGRALQGRGLVLSTQLGEDALVLQSDGGGRVRPRLVGEPAASTPTWSGPWRRSSAGRVYRRTAGAVTRRAGRCPGARLATRSRIPGRL